MSETRDCVRIALGLLAAILVAPFTVIAAQGLVAAPRTWPAILVIAVLAVIVAAPLSAIVALFVGVPAVALARWLRTRSPWYYVGCGLVTGPVGMLVAQGEIIHWADVAVYTSGGLAASLVYWLIAERGRSMESDTDV